MGGSEPAPYAGLFCEFHLMATTPPTLIHDPWRRLWRFFTSDGFLAAIIMLSAAQLLLVASWPQVPAGDPIAYSRWLSDTQTRFGSLFTALNALGLFALTTAPLFRLTLALLGLSSALRLLDLLEQVRHAIPANRGRARRANLAALLAYSGVLITLLGLFLGVWIDQRTDNIVAQPGIVTPLPGTPYGLRVDAIENEQAHVALLQETDTVAQGVLARKQPLQHGVSVYLAQTRPALNVSAARGTTETLTLQTAAATPAQAQVLLSFTPEQNDAFVAAPQVNLVLRVSSTGNQAYVAQIYQSATGKDLGSQSFAPGGNITMDGVTFTFQPAAYIIVSIANQPSHWLAALGLLLTTLGLAGVWLWPSRIAAPPSRSERAAVVLVRAAWLIATLLVWGQLIAVYPYLASFDGLATSIECSLAAWLLLSGSLIMQHRLRWGLLLLGSAAVALTGMMLVTALE